MSNEIDNPLETVLTALSQIPQLIQLQQMQSNQIAELNKTLNLLTKNITGKDASRQVFNVKQAAEYLGGIHPESVRKKIRENQITKNKAFRKILITKAELDRYIKDST